MITLDQRVANTKQLPGETVNGFCTRVNKAVRELRYASKPHPGMSGAAWAANWEDKTYTQFIGGLRHDLYTFVMSRNPTNLKEAKAAALTAEDTQNRGKLYSVEATRDWSQSEAHFAHVYHTELELQDKLEQVQAEKRKLEGESSQTRSRPQTPYRGYGSSSAPLSRSSSPSGGQRFRSPRRTACNICNQEGHWARECPYKACGIFQQGGHMPYEFPS